MNTTPSGWGEALERFARALGGGAAGRIAADEWLRQATGGELHELTEAERTTGFQAFALALYVIEGAADLAFDPEQRWFVGTTLQASFGLAGRPEGPPWRVAPTEKDRPTYEEWGDSAAFD